MGQLTTDWSVIAPVIPDAADIATAAKIHATAQAISAAQSPPASGTGTDSTVGGNGTDTVQGAGGNPPTT